MPACLSGWLGVSLLINTFRQVISPASEMTYTVLGGALNSAQPQVISHKVQ